ncbi:hypothetical protein [Nocardioides zeae]|uniref:Uncharacterized protein n=1 Tax=Nocardioides zeae TaxID=1457234 RepID=A0A6P0HJX4_9ACTN|nr:hypothetical protein [Nocardioides zeae]NEN78923.1 hypothetical protein [Nocardioides zeae]
MSAATLVPIAAFVCILAGWSLVWRGQVLDSRYRDAKERAGEWPRHPSVRHTTPESKRLQRMGFPLLFVGLGLQAFSIFVL